jgi:hypothetical protein
VRELPALRPVVLLAKFLLRQAGCYRAGPTYGDGSSAERPADGTSQKDGSAAGPEVVDSTNAAGGRGARGYQHSTCSVSGTALVHMAAASLRWSMCQDSQVCSVIQRVLCSTCRVALCVVSTLNKHCSFVCGYTNCGIVLPAYVSSHAIGT